MSEQMCDFNSDSMRCSRCGYLAESLPTYRVCHTLEEIARHYLHTASSNRIRVPPIRLGDAVSSALEYVGVTKERVSKAIGKDCGCKQKQDTLNLIGMSVSGAVNNAANKVINALLPNPYSDDEVASLANSLAKNPETNKGLLAPPPAENEPPAIG